MDTDANVRKLVDLIFILGKKSIPPEDMASHSSNPSSFLNKDFVKRLIQVLDYRIVFVVTRWEKSLTRHFRKMLQSHANYLSYVMFACVYENKCNENIYDSFISVCLLISYFNEDILSKVAVDFRDLNLDIFMVFYRNEMNRPFRKPKYFYRLVEYIRNHKPTEWLNDSTSSTLAERHSENIRKDIGNYRATENLSHDTISKMQTTGSTLAFAVFSSTSVKLPDLPSENELIQRLVDYRKRETNEVKVETTLTMETSYEESLNSDSKTNFEKPQEDAAWHESIIEAVRRHNHSKDSGKEISNSQSHEEANDTLKHLESKINSLIEVLNECNE